MLYCAVHHDTQCHVTSCCSHKAGGNTCSAQRVLSTRPVLAVTAVMRVVQNPAIEHVVARQLEVQAFIW